MGLACPELAAYGCLISRTPHGKRIHPESAHPPAALNGHGAARRRLAKAGRAAELELTRPLFYTLRYLRRVLGAMIPAATLVAAEAGRPNLALLVLMDALFLRALQPPTPACGDRFSGGARVVLSIRGNWFLSRLYCYLVIYSTKLSFHRSKIWWCKPWKQLVNCREFLHSSCFFSNYLV
ncbi:hypothetical protein [Massilia sp. YIM B02443]|uniref:hypothetical protein n=1 Tax=Massilia sp. YIM B02443 TaxID=3050127 RepID=UPI0025B6C6D8|nr:hypothetical protein [Massilia sp. YIM B02443]MDN4038021.1 hypothetical protein [Massilia sp. YIM B02443]